MIKSQGIRKLQLNRSTVKDLTPPRGQADSVKGGGWSNNADPCDVCTA